MSVEVMDRPRLRPSRARGAASGAGTADAAPSDAGSWGPVPWGLADLRRLVRVLALSGTGLVVAWLVASGTTDPGRQAYAVAGGIVATAVAVAGLAGWLLAGMRAVRLQRDGSVRDVRALLALRSPGVVEPASAALVTAPGMTHVHDAACQMVRGKAVSAVDGRSSLARCPICLPGETS
jgi:hypothetical protein